MKEQANCIDGLNELDNEYSIFLSPSFNYDFFVKKEGIGMPSFSDEIKSGNLPESTREYIYVSVGDSVFTFKNKLKNIANQIEEAKEILNYAQNWDDENAEATDISTFLKSTNFLFNYSCFIERNFGVIIRAPYMDILKDGSIYLNWETDNSRFLIIFKKNNHPLAYFYGERIDKKGNKIPFKSAIEIEGDTDEIVAQWMKAYLM